MSTSTQRIVRTITTMLISVAFGAGGGPASSQPTAAPTSLPAFHPGGRTYTGKTTSSSGDLERAYKFERWRTGTVHSVAQDVITIAVPEYEGQAATVQTIRADEKTKILRAVPAKPPNNVKIMDSAPIVRLEFVMLSAVRPGVQVDFAWDEPDRAAIIEIVPARELTVVAEPPLALTPFPVASTPPTTQPGSAIP